MKRYQGIPAAAGLAWAPAAVARTVAGGKIPGAPPDWPAAANLTSGDGSGMSPYTSATAFGTMMRTGRRPDGTQVSSVMPFGALKHLSDTDVGALYAYLRTLPPQAKGPR